MNITKLSFTFLHFRKVGLRKKFSCELSCTPSKFKFYWNSEFLIVMLKYQAAKTENRAKMKIVMIVSKLLFMVKNLYKSCVRELGFAWLQSIHSPWRSVVRRTFSRFASFFDIHPSSIKGKYLVEVWELMDYVGVLCRGW